MKGLIKMQRERKEEKLLRTKDALRSQIITATNQINSETRLRRIAQHVSSEWVEEHGGLLIEEGTKS